VHEIPAAPLYFYPVEKSKFSDAQKMARQDSSICQTLITAKRAKANHDSTCLLAKGVREFDLMCDV
jgi:hypothetical protein